MLDTVLVTFLSQKHNTWHPPFEEWEVYLGSQFVEVSIRSWHQGRQAGMAKEERLTAWRESRERGQGRKREKDLSRSHLQGPSPLHITFNCKLKFQKPQLWVPEPWSYLGINCNRSLGKGDPVRLKFWKTLTNKAHFCLKIRSPSILLIGRKVPPLQQSLCCPTEKRQNRHRWGKSKQEEIFLMCVVSLVKSLCKQKKIILNWQHRYRNKSRSEKGKECLGGTVTACISTCLAISAK